MPIKNVSLSANFKDARAKLAIIILTHTTYGLIFTNVRKAVPKLPFTTFH